MKNNKRILVYCADTSGVTFHRLMTKFIYLGENYDIDTVMESDISKYTKEDYDKFDFFISNRHFAKLTADSESLIKLIKSSSCKLILDMDDHYQLNKEHLLYVGYEPFKKDIILCLKEADYIFVTHEHMLNTFSKDFNISKDKFLISPNCIDITQDQFKPTTNNISDRIKFGFAGSVTHFDDVLSLYEPIYQHIVGTNKDKIEINYGGYIKGDVVSEAIAGILSAKGKADEYQFQFSPILKLTEYANFYKNINVGLVPLIKNDFNIMKSNLKVLEIGAHKRGLICQNIHPYSDILTPKNSEILRGDFNSCHF
jgi:hypothetical protein